jgi:hypothetical protein
LGALEFLCRPAVREGEVSEEVISFSIRTAISDPETGELQFPDPDQDAARISQVQHRLAARSGIPVTTILKEQEARLTQGAPTKPSKPQPVAELDERQRFSHPEKGNFSEDGRREDPAQPVPSNTRETHFHPTLTANEQALLRFIAANPDLPVNQVYKRLGIKAAEVTKIRERLTEQGFLQDLEVRTGKATAGRPTKWIIPTFAALERLGIETPKAGAV